MHHLELNFATSTMQDGNMSYRFGDRAVVDGNRAAFLSRAGMLGVQVAAMDVTHGTDIALVSTDTRTTSDIYSVDALITNDLETVLFLLTADCLPVIIFDAKQRTLALLHLGWKPIVEGLVSKVLYTMHQKYGSNPGDQRVIIGPSIKKDSYVHKTITQQGAHWQRYLMSGSNGQTHVDLLGYVVDTLHAEGVHAHAIEVSPVDTATDGRYFSHYRASRTKEQEGRFATICKMVSRLDTHENATIMTV
jgi:YfiH family protein